MSDVPFVNPTGSGVDAAMGAARGRAANCTYRIGPDGALLAVDDGWTAFALENGAPELVPPAPLGRSIFEAIAGADVRALYRTLFERARASAKPVSFTFRCDAPTLKRTLRMVMTPERSGAFTLATALIAAEPRAYAAVLDVAVHDRQGFVTLCAWCSRVRVGSAWVDLDEAIDALGVMAGDAPPAVTHGICGDCAARTLAGAGL